MIMPVNHAAFLGWYPSHAYDICPQPRSGWEANQAMAVHGEDKRSLFESCRLSASNFLLSDREVRHLIKDRVGMITQLCGTICDEAELSKVDRG